MSGTSPSNSFKYISSGNLDQSKDNSESILAELRTEIEWLEIQNREWRTRLSLDKRKKSSKLTIGKWKTETFRSYVKWMAPLSEQDESNNNDIGRYHQAAMVATDDISEIGDGTLELFEPKMADAGPGEDNVVAENQKLREEQKKLRRQIETLEIELSQLKLLLDTKGPEISLRSPTLDVAASAVQPLNFNVLLIGGAGSGKSTLINSLANYLRFDSFKEAKTDQKLFALIPGRCEVDVGGGQMARVDFGPDDRRRGLEHFDGSQSSTLTCISYVLDFDQTFKIRLIDTPGLWGSRYREADDEKVRAILRYASAYDVHSIWVFPFGIQPEYLLNRINRTWNAGFRYVFTFTDRHKAIKWTMDEFRATLIRTRPTEGGDDGKVYKLTNAPFRCLAVTQEGQAKISKRTGEEAKKSWTKAVSKCRKLIMDVIEERYASNVRVSVRKSCYTAGWNGLAKGQVGLQVEHNLDEWPKRSKLYHQLLEAFSSGQQRYSGAKTDLYCT